jgi:beta-lactam-binding protein with PASTA domain
VPKGEVIATTPAGPASLSAGTAVTFTVSSGKPPKHKHSKAKPKG